MHFGIRNCARMPPIPVPYRNGRHFGTVSNTEMYFQQRTFLFIFTFSTNSMSFSLLYFFAQIRIFVEEIRIRYKTNTHRHAYTHTQPHWNIHRTWHVFHANAQLYFLVLKLTLIWASSCNERLSLTWARFISVYSFLHSALTLCLSLFSISLRR